MHTIIFRKHQKNHLERATMLKLSEIQRKLYANNDKASHLERMTTSILTSKDFINCSKVLMEIYRGIGESIQSIQDFSTSSLRVMGVEIGPLRILLPWNINLNVGKTQGKKILDSLLQDLESVVGKCILVQNRLSALENVHSPREINLIDLSNQSEWSSEILLEVISTLESALDDNLDGISILQSLIEWDYSNRYSVGETDPSEFYMDENNNSIVFYGNDAEEKSFRGLNERSTLLPTRSRRWMKSVLFSFVFCSILVTFALYVYF